MFGIIAAVLWLGVPPRGGLVALYLGLLPNLLSVIGIGLRISSFADMQQQALLSTFLVVVPSITLSRFATPILNIAPLIQDITCLNPMRYFLIVMRGVFLEGTST